ncbi:TPA: acetylglutamate kinase [Staphylococcus aureus]|nr:acetylglutamate kinase [Staphylococcus aureus]HBG3057589.1 acetylglutamate kinase [Staphylococcus aureus]HBG3059778.1 acetylglutamate kinase [Staphylococcus aureus]HBG3062455.1 acetylglutamate kinase [Staphylococcus aureus]
MHIGLRANKKDFGWIYSSSLASAATVYTLNQFKAAPLIVTEDTLQKSKGKLQALVVNSANANSCTGQQGIDDAQQTQTWVAQQLQIPSEHVAVASTGVIGEYLPMDKIKTGTEHIKDINFATPGAFNEAILTTDTCTKHIAVSLKIDGKTVTIGGSAKGSGMIHPNMATMLAFITTDASIESNTLHQLLKSSTDHTFNMITVNGLRVTDKATMTITKHTLIADVNTALVAQFNQHQCSAIGLCGLDAQLFEIKRFDQQYGYVGVPTALNKDALQYICTKFVPIINSIGFNNHDGEFYNINADTLAYFIASSLKAPIYVLSNIAGVLINDVVIPQLPLVDIHQYIEHGDIYGGMIPKVLDAKNAIENGCPKVIIASGNKPNIIESIYNNDFVGTTILNS